MVFRVECCNEQCSHVWYAILQHVKDEVKRIDIGKEAAIEAEVKAARERAIVPLEIRMKQFRDLLAEKGVCELLSSHYNLLTL